MLNWQQHPKIASFVNDEQHDSFMCEQGRMVTYQGKIFSSRVRLCFLGSNKHVARILRFIKIFRCVPVQNEFIYCYFLGCCFNGGYLRSVWGNKLNPAAATAPTLLRPHDSLLYEVKESGGGWLYVNFVYFNDFVKRFSCNLLLRRII